MIEKECRRAATTPLVFFLSTVLLLLLWNASGVFAAPTRVTAETRRTEFRDRNDISKIMSVLESRKANKKVLEKAADKVSEMNERNLRLMSSLCDRITADAGTPAADLAFSLLTALIVLS